MFYVLQVRTCARIVKQRDCFTYAKVVSNIRSKLFEKAIDLQKVISPSKRWKLLFKSADTSSELLTKLAAALRTPEKMSDEDRRKLVDSLNETDANLKLSDFEGDIVLSEAGIVPAEYLQMFPEKSLELHDLEIEGPLQIGEDPLTIATDDDLAFEPPNYKFTGIKITGGLDIVGPVASFQCSSTTIAGELTADNLTCDGNFETHQLIASGVKIPMGKIGGELIISDCDIQGGVNLEGCDVISDFVASGKVAESLEARNLGIGRNTSLRKLSVGGDAIFTEAKFGRPGRRSSSQHAADFSNFIANGTVDFSSATFNDVPIFYGARIDANPRFDGTTWPAMKGQAPEDRIEAGLRFACLRKIADKEQRFELAHSFLRLELDNKSAAWKDWPVRFLTHYCRKTKFGWSTQKPALWLLGLIAIGALFNFGTECPSFSTRDICIPLHQHLLNNVFRSVDTTFPFLNLRVDPPANNTNFLLKAFELAQAILGPVLVFLFLLAIRNRLRM